MSHRTETHEHPTSDSSEKIYDIVIWDASSFMGRLVVEKFVTKSEIPDSFHIGIASNSPQELYQIKDTLIRSSHFQGDISVLSVTGRDLSLEKSLEDIISKTKIFLNVSTYNDPFNRELFSKSRKYFSSLIYFCLKYKTHYFDIGMDLDLYHHVIEQFHTEAERKNTYIIPYAGFHSVPFDVGTLFLVEYIKENYFCEVAEITSILKYKGDLPVLSDSKYGTPKYKDYKKYTSTSKFFLPKYAGDYQVYSSHKFPASTVNEAVVKRTNQIFKKSYGRNFEYNEGVELCEGTKEYFWDILLKLLFVVLMLVPMIFGILLKLMSPKHVMSADRRAKNWYEIKLVADIDQDHILQVNECASKPDKKQRGPRSPNRICAVVAGTGDPSYDESAKYLTESVLYLMNCKGKIVPKGGVLTTGSFGPGFIKKLTEKEISFSILQDGKIKKMK